jgi:hypothetical protein
MKSPQELPQDANGRSPDELNFEQDLAEAEQSLQALKQRYVQVQQDQRTQAQLWQEQDKLEEQLQRSPSPELKAELQRIQNQLDDLEVNLETRLFAWDSLKEPFWQIIRFGGLGVLIGWGLAFVLIQSPTPTPQPSTPKPQRSMP